jgi:hypothetical protein
VVRTRALRPSTSGQVPTIFLPSFFNFFDSRFSFCATPERAHRGRRVRGRLGALPRAALVPKPGGPATISLPASWTVST